MRPFENFTPWTRQQFSQAQLTRRSCSIVFSRKQVDAGEKKLTTLDWFLNRTADGSGKTAPRELIHLLSAARDHQLKSLEKTQQSPSTLASIWGLSESEALSKAEQLTEIGFFQKRGSKEEPLFWVPFLYRGALNLVQGQAE